jgi:hypothetical protein
VNITIPDEHVTLIADALAADAGVNPPLAADATAFVDRMIRGHVGRVVRQYEGSLRVQSAVRVAQAEFEAEPEPSGVESTLVRDAAAYGAEYAAWRAGERVSAGDVRAYRGVLYEVVRAHTTQADWTPDVVPALWKVHRSGSGSQQGEAPPSGRNPQARTTPTAAASHASAPDAIRRRA